MNPGCTQGGGGEAGRPRLVLLTCRPSRLFQGGPLGFLRVQGSAGPGPMHLGTGRALQCLPRSELGDSFALPSRPRSPALPLAHRASLCPLCVPPLIRCGRSRAGQPTPSPERRLPASQTHLRPAGSAHGVAGRRGAPAWVSELATQGAWALLPGLQRGGGSTLDPEPRASVPRSCALSWPQTVRTGTAQSQTRRPHSVA